MLVEVHRARTRLDSVFAMTRLLPLDDLEIRAHWARYLCVLTSGFLEESLRLILEEFGKKMAHPSVARYMNSSLQGISGVNDERLRQLIGSFSDEWRTAYERDLQDRYKAHLDSLVANRHQIAHGRWVGISIQRITEYYRSVIAVIEWVHDSCCGLHRPRH